MDRTGGLVFYLLFSPRGCRPSLEDFFSFSDGCPTWSFHHVQAFSIGRGDKRDFFSHALFSVA